MIKNTFAILVCFLLISGTVFAQGATGQAEEPDLVIPTGFPEADPKVNQIMTDVYDGQAVDSTVLEELTPDQVAELKDAFDHLATRELVTINEPGNLETYLATRDIIVEEGSGLSIASASRDTTNPEMKVVLQIGNNADARKLEVNLDTLPISRINADGTIELQDGTIAEAIAPAGDLPPKVELIRGEYIVSNGARLIDPKKTTNAFNHGVIQLGEKEVTTVTDDGMRVYYDPGNNQYSTSRAAIAYPSPQDFEKQITVIADTITYNANADTVQVEGGLSYFENNNEILKANLPEGVSAAIADSYGACAAPCIFHGVNGDSPVTRIDLTGVESEIPAILQPDQVAALELVSPIPVTIMNDPSTGRLLAIRADLMGGGLLSFTDATGEPLATFDSKGDYSGTFPSEGIAGIMFETPNHFVLYDSSGEATRFTTGAPENKITTGLTREQRIQIQALAEFRLSSGLYVGVHNPAVERMQTMLKDVFGVDPGPSDGKFGSLTKAGVEAFQEQLGIPVTGNFDRDTQLAAIEKIYDQELPSQAAGLLSITQTLRQGDYNSQQVMLLQEIIGTEADGDFGPNTLEALKAKQQSLLRSDYPIGLNLENPDGVLGAQTRASLITELLNNNKIESTPVYSVDQRDIADNVFSEFAAVAHQAARDAEAATTRSERQGAGSLLSGGPDAHDPLGPNPTTSNEGGSGSTSAGDPEFKDFFFEDGSSGTQPGSDAGTPKIEESSLGDGGLRGSDVINIMTRDRTKEDLIKSASELATAAIEGAVSSIYSLAESINSLSDWNVQIWGSSDQEPAVQSAPAEGGTSGVSRESSRLNTGSDVPSYNSDQIEQLGEINGDLQFEVVQSISYVRKLEEKVARGEPLTSYQKEGLKLSKDLLISTYNVHFNQRQQASAAE